MKILLAVLLILIALFGMGSSSKIPSLRHRRVRPEYPGVKLLWIKLKVLKLLINFLYWIVRFGDFDALLYRSLIIDKSHEYVPSHD